MKTPTYTFFAICLALFLAVLFLILPSPTSPEPPAEVLAPGVKSRTAVAEVESIEGTPMVAGQTVYVPSYSSIYTSDRAHSVFLAVTLSIRNTDPKQPIYITTAHYYDQDGQLVRDYLKKSLRIGPMASMEFFVPESDTSGGVSASFLVEWGAEQRVHAPLIESVMIGTASTQGVALTCPGRVLKDRSRPDPVGDEGR